MRSFARGGLAVLLPVLCSVVLSSAGVVAQDDKAAALDDKQAELVATARTKLAAVGYTVPAAVGARTRTAAEVIDDLQAHQDLMFPRDGFELQFALLRALKLGAGRDAAALRERAVAGMARGHAAYYDPIAKTFVLLPTAARDLADALGGSLALVTHELVHACQDARDGGLAGFFAGNDGSIDRVLARRIVVEGEAEVVAAWALHGEEMAKNLGAAEAANSLGKLFAGQLTGAIYEAGRRVAAAQFAAGGRDALAKLWAAPAASTEQLLHAGKLGRDLPQDVPLPDFGSVRVVARTTCGELLMQDLLRQLGAHTTAAFCGACGWDGDTFAIVESKSANGDDARGVVWRTFWDRDEDAVQFEQLLAKKKRGRIHRQGRVVDWAQAQNDALQAELAASLLASVPELAADGEAAASTAAAEEAVQKDAAAQGVRGDRWEIDKFGLSLPVPKGWELRERRGAKILVDGTGARNGFTNNANVQAVPRGSVADAEQLLAANRTEFAKVPTLTIDAAKIGERSGQPVVEMEFHGKVASSPELRFLTLYYLRGQQQVAVTFTVRADDWQEHEESLRAVLAGITITPE
jgi:hypothetical protein